MAIYSYNVEPMFQTRLAQSGLYMPTIVFNTNPGGLVVVGRDDGQLSVCRILDVTAPEAALVNWFPRLSPQQWVVPPHHRFANSPPDRAVSIQIDLSHLFRQHY
jgi:hypothetical protein